MKEQNRKIYKSANGKVVDMDLLRQRNELTPAVGNARVNARGDELGPGGKIIKKKEEVLQDYYAESKNVKEEDVVSDQVDNNADDWVEDKDGNFVPRNG